MGPDSGDVAELGLLFAEIATAVHRAGADTVAPDRLVRLAASAIPHAHHCSVTLLQPRRRPHPAASSDPLAVTVEELQDKLGEGPCLDAARGDDLVLVNDLGIDPRWPRSQEKAGQLETALSTSRQIGAAVGIAMAQRGLTYDQAFEQLRRASQHLNVKLRDLAAEIEYTGVVPDPRPQPRD